MGAALEPMELRPRAELEQPAAAAELEPSAPELEQAAAGAAELEQLELGQLPPSVVGRVAQGYDLPAGPAGGALARLAEARAELRAAAQRAELEREEEEHAPAVRGPLSLLFKGRARPSRGNVMPRETTTTTKRKGSGIEADYAQLWATQKVDRKAYDQLFAGLLVGATTGEDVARAADLADLAYLELMKRERGSF